MEHFNENFLDLVLKRSTKSWNYKTNCLATEGKWCENLWVPKRYPTKWTIHPLRKCTAAHTTWRYCSWYWLLDIVSDSSDLICHIYAHYTRRKNYCHWNITMQYSAILTQRYNSATWQPFCATVFQWSLRSENNENENKKELLKCT